MFRTKPLTKTKKHPRQTYKKKVRLGCVWSEWRESNSRPLEPHCAPFADTLVKTAHNIRHITNFRIRFFILFHLMSRSFVSIVVKLWSNDPDKWLFSPAKLHRAISIFINRSCAFCLHELSIRRIRQPCQWIIVIFSSLTQPYGIDISMLYGLNYLRLCYLSFQR